MALSEQERKLLEELERGFYASEADVRSTAPGAARTLNYRMLAIGLLITLVGVAVLVAAVAIPLTWLGVIGFAIMVLGVVFMLSPGKPGEAQPASKDGSDAQPAKSAPKRESLSERLERRWDQRMNGEL